MDSSRLSPGWEWGSCPDKYRKAIEIIAKGLVAITQDDYRGIEKIKKAAKLLIEEKMQHSFIIKWHAVDYQRHEEIGCEDFIEKAIVAIGD